MKKFRFFEWHELFFMPPFFRNGLTNFLQLFLVRYRVYQPAAKLLSKLLHLMQTQKITDLCSGGSGPYLQLLPLIEHDLQIPIKVELCDLHPNVPAFTAIFNESQGKITGITQPIDARSYEFKSDCVYSFFSSFHHFTPLAAQQVLKKIVAARAAICIVEFTNQGLLQIFKDLLIPFSVLFLMPQMRGFSWRHGLFTYLIPVFPLMIGFDAIVSRLRSYTQAEYRMMINPLEQRNYVWEAGILPSGFNHCKLSYLIGYPK